MNPFENRREEAEKIHSAFFKAHRLIAKAHDEFNAALLVIQKMEDYSDSREKVKKYRVGIEGFRGTAEKLLFDASDFRTAMIGETGCSGECHQ